MLTPSRASFVIAFLPIAASERASAAILEGCNDFGNCSEFEYEPAMMPALLWGIGHDGRDGSRDAGASWRRPRCVRRPAARPCRAGAARTAQADLSVLSPHNSRAGAALAERYHHARHADERTSDFQRASGALL